MLSIVTPVSVEEAITALLMTFNGFVLLTSYACIKPVREAWILALPSGPEIKIYTGVAIGATATVVVPLYAKAATRLARNRLIIVTSAIFSLQALLFWALGTYLGIAAWLAVAFYIWISIFNMMIVAQFWSFAADLYSDADGQRLFPLLALGASLGAVAGAALAGLFLAWFGPLILLPISTFLLMGSAGLVEVIHRRELRHGNNRLLKTQPITNQPEAFRYIIKHRYLSLLALFALLFTTVKTNGEYILASLVKHSTDVAIAHGELTKVQAHRYLGAFYARYQLWVNIGSLVLQTFVVSRLVRLLGVRFAFMIFPVTSLLGTITLFGFPLVSVALPAKVAENATDYSLNNTVRNALWLPTSRRAKYVAKQVAETVCVRFGDVTSAILVFIGTGLASWPTRTFVGINAITTLIWLVVAWQIIVEHRRLPETGELKSNPEASPAPEPAKPTVAA